MEHVNLVRHYLQDVLHAHHLLARAARMGIIKVAQVVETVFTDVQNVMMALVVFNAKALTEKKEIPASMLALVLVQEVVAVFALVYLKPIYVMPLELIFILVLNVQRGVISKMCIIHIAMTQPDITASVINSLTNFLCFGFFPEGLKNFPPFF